MPLCGCMTMATVIIAVAGCSSWNSMASQQVMYMASRVLATNTHDTCSSARKAGSQAQRGAGARVRFWGAMPSGGAHGVEDFLHQPPQLREFARLQPAGLPFEQAA